MKSAAATESQPLLAASYKIVCSAGDGTIGGWAVAILTTADPAEKVRLSLAVAAAWKAGSIEAICGATVPDRPARPALPALCLPREMPRRRIGGIGGRIALLHALAHIELNAIDLAWDMIARFGGLSSRAFIDDWIEVAAEEAAHHVLLERRLNEYGATYGDLPAHDGLWEAAEMTSHDLLARLAVVPLVLEARGLDVTPTMIQALERAGDVKSAEVVRTILIDEITHVATGHRWFAKICQESGQAPAATWHTLVKRYFKGSLKPPFNHEARAAAGFGRDEYEGLVAKLVHRPEA